jgi:NADH:ubiquinone oxidoreductase subunit F (NADH-binding)
VGKHTTDFYHGHTTAELNDILRSHLTGQPTPSDTDAELPYRAQDFVLNPYGSSIPDYAALRHVVTARDNALQKASAALTSLGWDEPSVEQFHEHVRQRTPLSKLEGAMKDAVLQWQNDSDWAKGETMAGWSEPVLKELDDAKLRGMGGAGIPHAQKIRDVRDAVRRARRRNMDDRAFIVVNGDESEPGTFKDREILLRLPHVVIEGVLIAGILSDATQGFIYIRHEYEEQIEACRAEIARAEQLGLCGPNAFLLGRPFPLSVFVSPGGYICGEQSALIEAMSDRRGEPRNLPPKLETNGLEDMPTLVSNVETYSWIPYITLRSGKTYAGLGVNGWSGRRLFSISGDVKRPGVYEVPMGMTLRELVYGENYCQGIIGDKKLKGFAPSGPSGGFLPAVLTDRAGLPRDHVNNAAWKALTERRGLDSNSPSLQVVDLELELDLFRALSPTQALGAGLVVYAEGRDMAEQAVNSLEFYRNESCGKCVPCRLGSQKFAALGAHLLLGNITAERWEKEIVPLVGDMSQVLELASICGLGRSVPVPIRTVANFFKDDLNSHLRP